ncbi:MAG: LPXTG cell wall anchor domain-containing protein, partial [Actinomycetota bacterium]
LIPGRTLKLSKAGTFQGVLAAAPIKAPKVLGTKTERKQLPATGAGDHLFAALALLAGAAGVMRFRARFASR